MKAVLRDPQALSTARDLCRRGEPGVMQGDLHLGSVTLPLAFTVGLHALRGHPEIVCVGLDHESVNDVLTSLSHMALERQPLPAPHEPFSYSETPGHRFTLKPMSPQMASRVLGPIATLWPCGPASAMQLAWSDPSGWFPWQDGFDAAYRRGVYALYE